MAAMSLAGSWAQAPMESCTWPPSETLAGQSFWLKPRLDFFFPPSSGGLAKVKDLFKWNIPCESTKDFSMGRYSFFGKQTRVSGGSTAACRAALDSKSPISFLRGVGGVMYPALGQGIPRLKFVGSSLC